MPRNRLDLMNLFASDLFSRTCYRTLLPILEAEDGAWNQGRGQRQGRHVELREQHSEMSMNKAEQYLATGG